MKRVEVMDSAPEIRGFGTTFTLRPSYLEYLGAFSLLKLS